MPIEFACSSCRQTVRVADAAAGKKGKCPKCGTILDIPLASPAAPAASPAAPARPKSAAASAPQPVSNPAAKPAAQGAPKPTAKVSGNNVSFPCPSCAKPIVAPAALTGKKGKCPHCQAKVVIGGASPPETDGLQPLGPDDLAPLGPGDLAPLGGGTGDLFADLPPLGGPANSPFGGQPLPNTPPLNPLGVAPSPLGAPSPYGAPVQSPNPFASPNPYAAPSPFGASPYGASPYGGAMQGGNYARPSVAPAKLMIPAIGLIAVSIITIISLVVQIGATIANPQPPNRRAQVQGNSSAYLVGAIVGGMLGLLVNGVVIAGAVQMIRLRGWNTAKSGATVSLIPCSCLCINIPLGIWALIVLNQPDVKRLFYD
jgi:DNA-directed RNA polymerase subunit RPC12/RpoP